MEIYQTKTYTHSCLTKLTELHKTPAEIFYLGQLPTEFDKVVAIVGSRKPSSYGRQIAYQLAYDLSAKGIVIISGLALGIDAIAHKACLDAGGRTIAVIGGGLNYITPISNKPLAQRILDNQGCIISEYKSDHPVKPHQFLERNRLISGLASVVIVVEAAKRSGSLSTAAHAIEQNREVFAVPGNINNPMAHGCNNLIRQGAQLVTSAQDVIDVLGIQPTQTTFNVFSQPKDPIQQAIINLLKNNLTDGDEIIQQLKLSPTDFNYHITLLELNGFIKSHGNNQWTLL